MITERPSGQPISTSEDERRLTRVGVENIDCSFTPECVIRQVGGDVDWSHCRVSLGIYAPYPLVSFGRQGDRQKVADTSFLIQLAVLTC